MPHMPVNNLAMWHIFHPRKTMIGQLSVHEFNDPFLRIHVITSPETGGAEGVNSTIIETQKKLIIVDTALFYNIASEIKEYAQSLGKEIAKVVITHDHPDHWFGSYAYKGNPIYALKDVISKIENLAPGILKLKRTQLAPEELPPEVELPTQELKPGIEVIDGVTFDWKVATDVEYELGLFLVLPDHKVMVAADLLYNNSHLFLGERLKDKKPSAASWLSYLKTLDKDNFKGIVPGHGMPGDASIIDFCIGYLEAMVPVINQPGMTSSLYKEKALELFPDAKLESMLELSGFFLFDFTSL